MSYGEVTQSIVCQPRIPWRRRAAQICGRQGLVLSAVGIEETAGKLALAALQVINIDYELILIKFSGNTERRESPQRKRLGRVNCLWGRNSVLAVRQFQAQNCECRRADVRAIGRHRNSALCSGLTGKQFSQGGARPIVSECR